MCLDIRLLLRDNPNHTHGKHTLLHSSTETEGRGYCLTLLGNARVRDPFCQNETTTPSLCLIQDGVFGAYYATAKEALAVLPETIAVEAGTLSDNLHVVWSVQGTYDPTPAAENTFTWTIDDARAQNYDFGALPSSGTIVMTNKDAEAVDIVSSPVTVTYAGAVIDVASLGLFAIDANAGVATYALLPGGSGAGSLDGTSLTVTKAGTFTIQVDTQANGAFGAGNAQAALTVNRGVGQASVTISESTFGQSLAPQAASTTHDAAGATFEWREQGAGSWSSVEPTTVGAYEVRTLLAANDLYDAVVSEPVSFAILPVVIVDLPEIAPIAAPVAGEPLSAQADLVDSAGDPYPFATETLRWTLEGAPVSAGTPAAHATAYQAIVKLIPAANHVFDADAAGAITMNGKPATTAALNLDGSLTLTFAFPETAEDPSAGKDPDTPGKDDDPNVPDADNDPNVPDKDDGANTPNEGGNNTDKNHAVGTNNNSNDAAKDTSASKNILAPTGDSAPVVPLAFSFVGALVVAGAALRLRHTK